MRMMPKIKAYALFRQILENMIKNPSIQIKIACLKEDPYVILGYSVTEKTSESESILHWVYVKKLWRSIGLLFDLLLDAAPISYYSHTSKAFEAILQKNPHSMKYNAFYLLPYLITQENV